MRGINFRSLLNNWDSVIHKLCEEVTTYDVLTIVRNHVGLIVKDLKKNKMNSDKAEKALKHLDEALSLLNPEI